MQSEEHSRIAEQLQVALKKFHEGRFSEAEQTFQEILRLQPDQPDALHLSGLTALQLGKKERALELVRKARELRPKIPQFAYSSAMVNIALGHLQDGLLALEQALDMKPDFVEALTSRGHILQKLNRQQEALSSYDKALAAKPDDAEVWNNRGGTLHILKRYDDALASYDRALKIAPRYAEALDNRGLALHELRRYDEAIASFDAAIAANPPKIQSVLNRGHALRELGRYGDALANYERVLAVDPQSADAHANSSLCRLLLGDLERGWPAYEWRWRLSEFRRDPVRPRWSGRESLSGKKIVLYAEQGLGDTIQFARYADTLSKKGASVILHIQPALKNLLSSIPNVKVLGQNEPLPPSDFECPLLSLPLALNTRLNTIPASIPYLTVPAAATRKWELILGPSNPPRVGIVWSGGTATRHDFKRSVPLSSLLIVGKVPVKLISLQKEIRPEDEHVLKAHPEILHFGAKLEDFSDTAALVSLMDLVITVDTSVAHLAGALGKPLWVLLPFSPDWRWLLDRRDSPWYSTARLFRQGRVGDWKSVMEEVTQSLGEFAKNAGRRAPSAPPGDEAPPLIEQGERELAAGRFPEAEKLLSKAASTNPGSARAQHLLGVAIHEQGNIDRAIACYRKALKLEPRFADAHQVLGRAYMEKRKFGDAFGCYRDAMTINPSDEVACSGAASALRELGDFVAARKLFQRALWLRVRRWSSAPWRALRRLG